MHHHDIDALMTPAPWGLRKPQTLNKTINAASLRNRRPVMTETDSLFSGTDAIVKSSFWRTDQLHYPRAACDRWCCNGIIKFDTRYHEIWDNWMKTNFWIAWRLRCGAKAKAETTILCDSAKSWEVLITQQIEFNGKKYLSLSHLHFFWDMSEERKDKLRKDFLDATHIHVVGGLSNIWEVVEIESKLNS